MKTINGLPTTRPTRTYDFAKSGVLPPEITFKRASTATYFDENGEMQIAGVNQPRIDYDPATGKSLGLLLEPAATNIATDVVTQFTKGGWYSGDGFTCTEVDGWLKIDVAASTKNSRSIYRLFPSPVMNVCTISVDVTDNDLTEASVLLSFNSLIHGYLVYSAMLNDTGTDKLAVVPSTNGKVTPSFLGATKTRIAGGWRISISGIKNDTTYDTTYIYVGLYPGGSSSLIKGTQSFRRLQIEASEFPTSYIPTVAESVTRAAEEVSYNIEENEKTSVLEFSNARTNNLYGIPYSVYTSSNTLKTSIIIYNRVNGYNKIGYTGPDLNFLFSEKMNQIGINRLAIRHDGPVTGYFNGEKVFTGGFTTPPSQTVYLGSNHDGVQNSRVHYSSIKVYGLGITDEQGNRLTNIK